MKNKIIAAINERVDELIEVKPEFVDDKLNPISSELIIKTLNQIRTSFLDMTEKSFEDEIEYHLAVTVLYYRIKFGWDSIKVFFDGDIKTVLYGSVMLPLIENTEEKRGLLVKLMLNFP